MFNFFIKNNKKGEWKVLAVPRSELNLRVTLLCGQSFRWREIGSQVYINFNKKKTSFFLSFSIIKKTNCYNN